MKAIIFDVDGVLIVDKDKSGEYLWQKNIERDLGIRPDQVSQIYSGDWSLVLKGLVDSHQHFKNMFEKLKIEVSVDEFVEYWLKNDLNVNIEILQVIELIKGPKLYVGTNQDRCRTLVLEETFGSYFDKIFSSYKIGAMKPELEFYRHIESDLKLQSKEIAFVDDSKSHVEAAAQLGWICHHYQNIEKFKDFIRVYRIT